MRARGAVAVLAVVLCASSCTADGLTRDQALRIVSPSARGAVRLPFTITWRAVPGRRVLLLIDHAPMRPGAPLRSLVPESDPCRSEPGCPDATWLNERHVYVSGGTSITVDTLADNRPNNRTHDRHEITAVVVDQAGTRVGSAAAVREFTVERD